LERKPRRVGQLQQRHQVAVYALSVGLLLSGVLWLYFHYFVRVTDQFGFENPHPLQGQLLVAHAVFALPGVWVFGFLWRIHFKPSWRASRKRLSGGTLWSAVLLMCLSGYALYYIGSESARDIVSVIHWVVGIAATVVLLLHARLWPFRGLFRGELDRIQAQSASPKVS
jgi:hypothetical protein